jgi:hypothetical protein
MNHSPDLGYYTNVPMEAAHTSSFEDPDKLQAMPTPTLNTSGMQNAEIDILYFKTQ